MCCACADCAACTALLARGRSAYVVYLAELPLTLSAGYFLAFWYPHMPCAFTEGAAAVVMVSTVTPCLIKVMTVDTVVSHDDHVSLHTYARC